MNDTTPRAGDYRFVLGLFTGTFVGAGLALWLGPRASETYQQARTRVADTVGDLSRRTQNVRDDIAGAVAHGAREVAHGALEVERIATAAARRPRAVDTKPPV